jgi:hypothetical protein
MKTRRKGTPRPIDTYRNSHWHTAKQKAHFAKLRSARRALWRALDLMDRNEGTNT